MKPWGAFVSFWWISFWSSAAWAATSGPAPTVDLGSSDLQGELRRPLVDRIEIARAIGPVFDRWVLHELRRIEIILVRPGAWRTLVRSEHAGSDRE